MSGCDSQKKLEELKKAKEYAAKLKEVKAQLQLDLRQKFEECKVACNFEGEECMMTDLKRCPVYLSVTKSGCSKKACLQKKLFEISKDSCEPAIYVGRKWG